MPYLSQCIIFAVLVNTILIQFLAFHKNVIRDVNILKKKLVQAISFNFSQSINYYHEILAKTQ